MKTMNVLALCLTSGFGAAVFAQGPLDRNGDGAVSLEEFQAARASAAAERFAELDADGDGLLTDEELATRRDGRRFGPGPGRRHGAPGARLDADQDGSVSLAELQAVHPNVTAEQFAEFDGDGDGALSRAELEAARGELMARMRERLEAIDTDGDGAWSFAELQAVRPNLDVEQFNRLDRNGDGLIGADERPLRGPGRRRGGGSL